MTPFYILVDCNNFYVSCERAFNPFYQGKPVVVLSNNDGCIIARSQEAKNLGLIMGEPYFKASKTCLENNVHVLSSNYELYGDMSERVMIILKQFSFEYELYSIDEAFLKVPLSSQEALQQIALIIQSRVLKWTGIPVSIGIGPTKTLAKVANYWAKKGCGISLLLTQKQIEHSLKNLPVEDVWGVGKKRAQKLKSCNIQTALDLQRAPSKFIRKLFTVTGEQLVFELNGLSCWDLSEKTPKQQIQFTRSFNRPITTLNEMIKALIDYTTRAAEKLREENLLTGCISFYFRTSKWDKNPIYQEKVLLLEAATNDTRTLIKVITQKVPALFQENALYKKAGICLHDLKPPSTHKTLFGTQEYTPKLMCVLDQLNKTFGKNTVFFASQLGSKPWLMASSYRTPRYTTCWEEILQI